VATTDFAGKSIQEVAGIVLLAMFSGMTGTWGYQQLQPPRPDPFTGTDGRQMRDQLSTRIGGVELDMAKLNAWKSEFVVQRVDVPNRLYRIEALLENNALALVEIKRRLDSLEMTRMEGHKP